MILSDFHIHTTFCDGKNPPEEMVISAIEKNMTNIGFSVHSYTFFDESYCIKKGETQNYLNELSALKEKYKDKIHIYAGVEQDYYSDSTTDDFDYVIGSVHYLKVNGEYCPIDFSADKLSKAVKDHFGGDFYLMTEHYFDTLSDIVSKTNADIIGHFDLITKFNETDNLFDAKNKRYIDAAKKYIDRLIPYGKPFEINTGAISRGYRTTPYPDLDLISYIIEKGGRLILSSDSHRAETLLFQFNKWKYLIK